MDERRCRVPELGVEIIDAQHHELERQVDKLIEALELARGRFEVASTLRFLETYAAQHFALEDRLMAEQAYPQREAHLREHAQFLETFSALAEQVRRQGPSSHAAILVNDEICSWLARHVMGTDKPMCEYLKSKGLR